MSSMPSNICFLAIVGSYDQYFMGLKTTVLMGMISIPEDVSYPDQMRIFSTQTMPDAPGT